MKDEEERRSVEEVHDRAARKRPSSHIDPTQKWDEDEEKEEGKYRRC